MSFPEDPGPPIVPAVSKTYTDFDSDLYLMFLKALGTDLKVDVTESPDGTSVDGATAHA